jgi:peptidoglycan/xylan/chitin deacetylase (PgdA/CDA1 family)
MSRLAILGFHRIGDPPADWDSWFYVPESTFVGYLTYLKDDGWHVIDMAAFLRGLEAPRTLPERAALLTFDDGYRSIREIAVPWLARFGFSAVMFVPTDFVGRSSSFDAGDEPEEPICDWAELRDLQRWGVSIQSHAASHRSFSKLDPAEQEAEVVKSKAVLEAELGTSVEALAYPYGDPGGNLNHSRMALHHAGYRAGFLYGGGLACLPADNPYMLPRIPMGPGTDLKAELPSDGH